MPDLLSEVRDKMWGVYLTLVSIVIGLSLENLVGQARTMRALWEWGPGSLLVWLQVALVFVMALYLWTIASYLTLSLRWDVVIRDVASALFTLVMLNAVIASIDPEATPTFFWIFGVATAGGGAAVAEWIGRAAQVPGNEPFLARFGLGRVYAGSGVMVALALATALLLQLGAAGVTVASFVTALLIGLALVLLADFSAKWWQALGRADRTDGRVIAE